MTLSPEETQQWLGMCRLDILKPYTAPHNNTVEPPLSGPRTCGHLLLPGSIVHMFWRSLPHAVTFMVDTVTLEIKKWQVPVRLCVLQRVFGFDFGQEIIYIIAEI